MDQRSGKTKRRVLVTLAVMASGSVSASGFLPSCETTLTTLNPCGSIFGFCDPTDVPLMFADIPDYELDPTCSIPYFGINNQGTGGGGGGQTGTCATEPIYPFTPGPRPD